MLTSAGLCCQWLLQDFLEMLPKVYKPHLTGGTLQFLANRLILLWRGCSKLYSVQQTSSSRSTLNTFKNFCNLMDLFMWLARKSQFHLSERQEHGPGNCCLGHWVWSFRKNFFTEKAVKHWNRLLREVAEILKRCVDMALRDTV